MSRRDARITKASVINLSRSRIQAKIDDPKTGTVDRFTLKMGLSNGAVEAIADMLFDMDLRITVDLDNPTHQAWIQKRAVVLED